MNRITVFDCRSFKVHVLIINLISHQFEEKQSFKQSCWKYFQFKLYNLFISALIFLKIQSNAQFLYIKQTKKKHKVAGKMKQMKFRNANMFRKVGANLWIELQLAFKCMY